MADSLKAFEYIARNAYRLSEDEPDTAARLHPFDTRNVFPGLPLKVKKLFDDGHYAESTFEAFKFIDKRIAHHANLKESGLKLMMAAFDDTKALIKLTPLKDSSEIDEQRGYRFLFSGAALAIRNPRAHEYGLNDDPDTCLDHLAFASLLLRRLQQAGFV